MTTLQQISDRLEIQNTLVKFTVAVDRHEWDVLDEVFTPGAILDFTDIGGWRGRVEEFRTWQSLPPVGTYYHMMGNLEIAIDGDTARTRCVHFNPMSDTPRGMMLVGHWYCDEWTRTTAGWRIRHRWYEPGYARVLPDPPSTAVGPR